MEEFFMPEKLNIVPSEMSISGRSSAASISRLPVFVRSPRDGPTKLEIDAADDRPLMLISLGTAFNAWPEFYRMCIDAFRDSDWRVMR
jgi:UDP:flavonoid glycosyltransferase YjiC (YdhE family)